MWERGTKKYCNKVKKFQLLQLWLYHLWYGRYLQPFLYCIIDTVLSLGNRPLQELTNLKTESVYWRKKSDSRSEFLLETWWYTEEWLIWHNVNIRHPPRGPWGYHWPHENQKTQICSRASQPTRMVCSHVKKTVPKDDDLINTSTEDRFIDHSVACDFRLNQVATLHWTCSFQLQVM